MKHALFISMSLLSFVLSLSASAQESTKLYGASPKIEEASSRKHFILELGYIGSTSIESNDPSDIQHGFSGGFLFDLYGEHYFTIETGAFITQQGFSYLSDATTVDGVSVGSGTNNVYGKATYIGIPLLAKLNFLGHATNTLFLIGGATPQMLLTSTTYMQQVDPTTGKSTFAQPTETTFNPPGYDVTGEIGLGGTFNVSDTQSILIQATYNRGFVALDDNGKVYNQSYLLTFGFGVDL